MKTNHMLAGAMVALVILSSCGNKNESVDANAQQAAAVATPLSKSFNVDATTSKLGWAGTKVTGAHNGSINIQSGSISVENDEIKAGSFVVDMNTIANTDLTDKKMNGDLVGHLSSPDFFDVAKFPSSKFEITATQKLAAADSLGNNYQISGNLTIKDVTKNITFPANVSMDSTQFAATAKFTIDRTEWNIQYGSGKFFKGLGDKMINDKIDFDLNLVAKP
jgi:polyisoprenoid-binding protein YceI